MKKTEEKKEDYKNEDSDSEEFLALWTICFAMQDVD